MATGTVADERKERKRELETTKGEDELAAAMAKYAAAELAASVAGDGAGPHPALVDRRLRRTALSAARLGLEAAYGGDRSDGAAASAPTCPKCGARMRHAGRAESPVERRRREPRAVGALRPAQRLVRRLLGRTAPASRVTVSAHSPRICRTPDRPRSTRAPSGRIPQWVKLVVSDPIGSVPNGLRSTLGRSDCKPGRTITWRRQRRSSGCGSEQRERGRPRSRTCS